MRRCSIIAAFLAAHQRALAHPLCYDNSPTDFTQVLTFCPEDPFALQGACCSDAEEAEVQARFEAAGTLTDGCADLYKQVQCGQCHSFSGHLFERLGGELGLEDGMTMTSDFCEELVSTCAGQIEFPTYDGESYCDKHTGSGDDYYWSYPYTEAEVFDSGLTQVFPDLDNTNDFPGETISMHQSPDGSMYWLMGQQGEIKSVNSDNLGSISTVVDISGGEFYEAYEEGLLDFAFGPLFSESGFPSYFYLSYTVQLDDGLNPRNRLSKFEYFPGDAAATRASEEILITTMSKSTSIHSGGFCGFKPSDYGNTAASNHDLYWSTGDGGEQEDPLNRGQDTTNLLGSIIRISVPSDGTGYTIPSGNLGSAPNVLPEICASGFRNPWRCGFDRETDELYCGDVGHTLIEEIDLIQCGNNYGWSRFEGSRCQEAMEERDGPCADADRSGFTFPFFEYCHYDYDSSDAAEAAFTAGIDICGDWGSLGTAVIGGHVYRGTTFADLIGGAYVFGDNESKNVYYIKKDGDSWTVGTIISDGSVAMVGFTEDIDGELMLITKDYNIYHMPCGDACSTTATLDTSLPVTVAATTSSPPEFTFDATKGSPPDFTFVGCFADTLDGRVFSGGEFSFAGMTSEICAGLCADSAFFGTQYSLECWCGDIASNTATNTDYAVHGEGICDYTCDGNPDEICGGYYANSVYAISENSVG